MLDSDADLSTVTDTYRDVDFDFNNNEESLGTSGPTLFGRDQEVSLLLQEYRRVLQTKHARTVVIHGESGSGKTVLADTLRDAVCNSSQGHFVAGKFFQNQGEEQEPYSAIMAAFSDLCDLKMQSDDFDEHQRIKIQRALGSEGPMLNRAITNLSPFIEDHYLKLRTTSQSPEEEIDVWNESSFVRFKVACKTFLTAMASERHPVVLFIDDIQWMDAGSQDIIAMFLQDKTLSNVLFILAYRDEEAASVVGLLEQKLYVDISVKNLNLSAVQGLLCYALDSEAFDALTELGRIVFKRTLGHPYYIIQFMETIQSERLLLFDDYTSSWTFDVDTIQLEITLSEDLADLLIRKAQRSSPEIRTILKAASLLGYRFYESVLLHAAPTLMSGSAAASENAKSIVLSSLSAAVGDGYIEKVAEGYQFIHDKVQAAFRSLIGAEEEDMLHLILGRTLLTLPNEKLNIYGAAVQLNAALSFCFNKEQRLELVRINLEASKYCMERSAFQSVASFLRKGLSQLTEEETWSEQYFDLTYEMKESLAKVELILGNFDACKAITKDLLLYGKSTKMMLPSLLVDVEVRLAGFEMNETIAAANRVLRLLGINLPRKIGPLRVLWKVLRMRRIIGRKTDEDILGLPMMNDHSMSVAVRILLHLSLACFLQHNDDHGVYAALVAAELTMRCGLSGYSANALAIYGASEQVLGNHARGYRFGQLALKMVNRIKFKESEAATVYTVTSWISHLHEPLRDIIDPISRVVNVAYESGDSIFMIMNLSAIFNLSLMMGTNLQKLESLMSDQYEQTQIIGNDTLRLWLQPSFQYVINLGTACVDFRALTTLTGDIMDEATYVQQVKDANQPHVFIAMAYVIKAHLACIGGVYDVAESALSDVAPIGQLISTSYGGIFWYSTASLTYFERFRMSQERHYLKEARKYKRLIAKRQAVGCPNCSEILVFLAAKEMALKKRSTDAELADAFDAAIDAFKNVRQYQYEGLANEHAGLVFARRGQRGAAEQYYERALYIYQNDWGSIAKFELLQARAARSLAGLTPPEGTEASGFTPLIGDVIICGDV